MRGEGGGRRGWTGGKGKNAGSGEERDAKGEMEGVEG